MSRKKGYHIGLLSGQLFSPVVLVVIVTTIITPGAAEKIYEINGINTTLIERNYDTPAILLKSVKSTPEFNYKRRKALRK